MTAPLSLGLACVAEPLAAFLVAHPAVTVDCILSDARCDLVADGIDLGLRVGVPESSSLLGQTIAPMPAAVVAAPAYVAAHGMPRHPRDMARHRVLGYGHDNRAAPIRLVGPDGEGASVEPSGPLLVNNGDMMLPLLLGGAACAMLPLFIVGAALRDGRLVRILPDWTPPLATLSLVTPPSRLRPARVVALAEHLIGALRTAMMRLEHPPSGAEERAPIP